MAGHFAKQRFRIEDGNKNVIFPIVTRRGGDDFFVIAEKHRVAIQTVKNAKWKVIEGYASEEISNVTSKSQECGNPHSLASSPSAAQAPGEFLPVDPSEVLGEALNLKLSAGLKARVEKAAKANNISTSVFVRRCLSEMVGVSTVSDTGKGKIPERKAPFDVDVIELLKAARKISATLPFWKLIHSSGAMPPSEMDRYYVPLTEVYAWLLEKAKEQKQ